MSDDWYGAANLEHFWTQRRFEVLSRMAGGLILESAAIAEVGCGHGLLQRQIEDNYDREVTGFDLNEVALKQTVSQTSLVCCYNVFQKSPEFEKRFDLIFLCNVLEHVRDEDRFIQAVQFHLAPAGKIVINVPAMQSMYSRFDQAVGHFRRYRIDSLEHIAQRNGMTVAAWSYWGLPLTPLLVLRKLWLAKQAQQRIISAGFGSGGPLINRLLLGLSRCEPIPQRMLGSAVMAIFEPA